MKVIYIASPYSGDTEENTAFARKAMLYAIIQNTVPIAPHLLYPQVLDDTDEQERNMGIQLGLEVLLKCDELWVIGEEISAGMQGGIAVAREFPTDTPNVSFGWWKAVHGNLKPRGENLS